MKSKKNEIVQFLRIFTFFNLCFKIFVLLHKTSYLFTYYINKIMTYALGKKRKNCTISFRFLKILCREYEILKGYSKSIFAK